MKSVRKCPNCEIEIPPGTGVKFDKDCTVLCVACGKPLIAATAASESLIKKTTITATRTTTTARRGGVPGYQMAHGYDPDYSTP